MRPVPPTSRCGRCAKCSSSSTTSTAPTDRQMPEPMATPALPPTGRRGRPRRITRESGLAPREEILREAARLFSARGVGATRITDIAAAVGITPPTIYYHFDNLGAIVGTLLTYVVDESAAFATAAARRAGPCDG